jgi:chemosensory pili system protein ChpA (sensor histidine kinase/response regulator)
VHILIVDDDEPVRALIERILSKTEHTTCKASTGEGGLELLRTEPVDVVLLDLGLPKMSGYEVAGRMRMDPKLRKIPIVIISGASPDEIKHKARSVTDAFETVVSILGKPIKGSELLKHLKYLGERTKS